jgi:hypothetical protein
VAPPVRVQETVLTQRVTEPKPGVQVHDLGRNLSGWPRLVVSGPAGSVVKLVPGELLDQRGLVNQRSSGGPVSFAYTLKGNGRETWSPRFSYYGFRYLQVEGACPAGTPAAQRAGRPLIEELGGQFLYGSAPVAGAFECSDATLNRIHQLILAAIRCNLQSVLTDCPHREKLGWLEVSHLLGRGIMYNFQAARFYTKVSRDMGEAQLDDGLVPDIAPEFTVFSGGFRDSPEWGSASVLNPWQVYEMYGDAGLLTEHYPVMTRYVEYLAGKATGHIVAHGLGDWYDIGPRGPGPSQLTSKGLTSTAIYHADLMVLAEAARLTGREAEHRAFTERAATVRAAFNARFFKADTASYDQGSQTAQAMPLVLGLAAAEHRGAVLQRLVSGIETNGFRVTAGDVGFMYLVRALTDGGRADLVHALVTQTNGPGYVDQLRKGATTLTEAWDANPSSSQNHCMLGHAEEWFYQGLAGLRPDPAGPGFRQFIVAPAVVNGLAWVRAHHDAPTGRIRSAWRRQGTAVEYEVEVPPNSRATVILPVRAGTEVREWRRPLASGNGVSVLSRSHQQITLSVTSGTYRFTAERP